MKEVKRQIGSLQRQAGKARRYRALFDELRVLDLHLSFRNSEQLKADIVQANEQVEKLRSIQVSLEEQIESQEFGLADQRHELEALEEQILVVRQTGKTSRIGSTLLSTGSPSTKNGRAKRRG